MTGSEQRTACRDMTAQASPEQFIRREIARECERAVHVIGAFGVPLAQWAGLGIWSTLSSATRSEVGALVLATLDQVLFDLAAVRARLVTDLAAGLTSLPDPALQSAPGQGLDALDSGRAVMRTFSRTETLRFISISLDQWAARTPDPYDEEARRTAGVRALGFLDGALTHLMPVRAYLAEHPTGPSS